MDAKTWETVTVTALLVIPDDEAVIDEVPLPTAVTRPDELTVATPTSDEAHVNVLPDRVVPPASRALALSWTVSPIETRLTVLGVTTTEATVGVPLPGPGSDVTSPPHERTNVTEDRAANVTKRMAESPFQSGSFVLVQRPLAIAVNLPLDVTIARSRPARDFLLPNDGTTR
jgi:hypothetical protein